MGRIERGIRMVIMAAGCVTLLLTFFTLFLAGISAVDRAICYPALRHGIVTGFSYDDGHTWYSDWNFGRYTFRTAHGDGQEHFYVAVEDGKGHTDFWEINREDQYSLEIGQEVSRSQLQ